MVVHMSTTLEQIVDDVMQLSAAQRAELTDLLAERLDVTPPDEVQKLWIHEAKERLAEVRAGKVETIPGDDVLAEARRLTRR
jgi:ribosomal protein L7/L12